MAVSIRAVNMRLITLNAIKASNYEVGFDGYTDDIPISNTSANNPELFEQELQKYRMERFWVSIKGKENNHYVDILYRDYDLDINRGHPHYGDMSINSKM